jgi:GH25 family lysozyme M1 (1,4-beta-N-acetylmuramidase)
MIKGIDVSGHQRSISWRAVKRAGVAFAFIKATEGVGFVDSAFERHRTDARRAGVPVGAYHFARPDTNISAQDPIAEADHFIDVAEPAEGDLLPVLDLETPGLSSAQMARWAKRFLQRVEKRIGEPPILYTFTSFWRDKVGDSRTFTRYPLWLANYGPNDGRPHDVSPVGGWSSIAIHQYTSEGSIPGFDGDLDLNRLMAGRELETLRVGAAPPPAPRFTAPWTLATRGAVLHEGRRLDSRFLERAGETARERGAVTIRGTRKG